MSLRYDYDYGPMDKTEPTDAKKAEATAGLQHAQQIRNSVPTHLWDDGNHEPEKDWWYDAVFTARNTLGQSEWWTLLRIKRIDKKLLRKPKRTVLQEIQRRKQDEEEAVPNMEREEQERLAEVRENKLRDGQSENVIEERLKGDSMGREADEKELEE